MRDQLLSGFVMGLVTGMAASLLLLAPLMVHDARSEIQAAWDADVQDSLRREQAAYDQGKHDALEAAELARECGE